MDSILELTRKANTIEEKVENISKLVSAYKDEIGVLEMEKDYEIDFDGMEELEEISLEQLDRYTTTAEEDFPDINTEDFGMTLKIAGDKKNEIIMALLLSGYKISLKDENFIVIEEGQEKFY